MGRQLVVCFGVGIEQRCPSAGSIGQRPLRGGGNFDTAGGKLSADLAKVLGRAVFTSVAPNPSGTEALLTFATAPGASLHLLSSTNLTTWETNSTVVAVGVTNSVSVNLTQPQEFFRLRRLP